MAVVTAEEYRAIAARLTIASSAYIDGKYRGKSAISLPSHNPATGEVIAELQCSGEAEVDLAVGKAREAFNNGCWSRQAPAERKKILIRLAKLVKRRAEEFAVLESLDSGKPIADCVGVDIPETIDTFLWHAEAIDKIYDQTAPVGDAAMAMIVREPIGVVGVVLPWNFPLLMLAWKAAPALAAGNSLIVKPAEQTTLTALKFAELTREAGIPPGVFNVVVGDGRVGKTLGMHPDVDMVAFTGSTGTGRCFLRYSAESNLKKVALECGGKNPAVVLSDAEDVESIAGHLVNAAFWNMGENCSANSRIIVEQGIRDRLIERLLHRTAELRVGDPLDPRNHHGAMINTEHYAKVEAMITQARQHGQLLCGGEGDGRFIPPTIIAVEDHDCALMQQEIFGPVVGVITVHSAEEALRLANDSCYGLAASIFTGNAKKAMRLARELRVGTVTVNAYGEGDMTTPFGGYKQSGFWGRDKGIHAHDQYTECKTIWWDLSDTKPDELP